ncbi:hypothetical protein R1flu_019010 [Riccia fluitans]|uniref:Uncharacterized protein n=1 Tax=Riccia fluitans TaxID=41844 RepID=A0ABD1ZHG6_9MARC
MRHGSPVVDSQGAQLTSQCVNLGECALPGTGIPNATALKNSQEEMENQKMDKAMDFQPNLFDIGTDSSDLDSKATDSAVGKLQQ